MFAGKKSAQIREILINESAWEEMTCLFAPSLTLRIVCRVVRSYDKATVQDVMLGAIEKRFGDKVPEQSIQWLTDNG